MKLLKTIGSVLRSACVLFAIIILCFIISIFLFYDPERAGVTPSVSLCIFGFSLALACANYIYFKTQLSTIIKYFIHLFLVVGSLVASFVILAANNVGDIGIGAVVLFGGFCLAVIHLIFFLVFTIIAKRMHKHQDDYKPMYNTLKKDKK